MGTRVTYNLKKSRKRRKLPLGVRLLIRALIKGGFSFAIGYIVSPFLGFLACVFSELLDPILDKAGLDQEP